MKEVIILGAGGIAPQVTWFAERGGKYKVVGFVDETLSEQTTLKGLPVFTSVSDIEGRFANPALFSAVGDVALRKRWADEYASDYTFVSIIDPSVRIAPRAQIGEGCLLYPDVLEPSGLLESV